jgi:hypothetical protein
MQIRNILQVLVPTHDSRTFTASIPWRPGGISGGREHETSEPDKLGRSGLVIMMRENEDAFCILLEFEEPKAD